MEQVIQLPLALLQLLEVLGQSFKPPTDPHRCMAASAGRQQEGSAAPSPLPWSCDPQQPVCCCPLPLMAWVLSRVSKADWLDSESGPNVWEHPRGPCRGLDKYTRADIPWNTL